MIGREPRNPTDRPTWARRRTGDPSIPLDLGMIHSAVRIIGDVPNPKRLTGRTRGAIGTGFLMTVASETLPNVVYGYVLTAHHVIDCQSVVDVQAPNPFANGALYEPLRIDDWRQPLPDVDLALAPFPDHPDRNYPGITLEEFLIPNEWAVSPHLGSRFYYIGILTPLDRPMVRAGTIGALDQIGLSYNPMYDYPVHLVDCRSYGGFSGSPCWIEISYADLRQLILPEQMARGLPDPPPPLGQIHYLARLCGMFVAHLSDDARFAGEYGVGVMLRGNEIREALMTDEARKERRKWDAEHEAAKDDDPKLHPAGTTDDQSEFERFEDLTRKLVNTPKTEVDEKRKSAQ